MQCTPGAELAAALDVARIMHIVRKGTDPAIDSYSGFFDNGHRQATGLEALLRAQGAETLYLLGLATDYCVKFTALDARRLGFTTVLVVDGCRGVNLHPGDTEQAMREMREAGVEMVSSDAVMKPKC